MNISKIPLRNNVSSCLATFIVNYKTNAIYWKDFLSELGNEVCNRSNRQLQLVLNNITIYDSIES